MIDRKHELPITKQAQLRWRDARMALRWTGTAMLEAAKSFRRLKAHKQLPILRAALLRHQQALLSDQLIASKNLAA